MKHIPKEAREKKVSKFVNENTVVAMDKYYQQMEDFIEKGLKEHCPNALKHLNKGRKFFAKMSLKINSVKIVKKSGQWNKKKLETWVEIVKNNITVARHRFVLKLRESK